MILETFQPFETKTGLPSTGQYIFVEKCPNEYILIRAKTLTGIREYTLKERETNYVPEGEQFTELEVINNGEKMGAVRIRTGFGKFTQSNDRQRVLVDNDVHFPSNIQFIEPQPIMPSSTALFKTVVQNWPTDYRVSFKGSQPVHFDGVQSVKIENELMATVKSAGAATLKSGKAQLAAGVVTEIVSANAGRRSVLIFCDALTYVGGTGLDASTGIRVDAGESIEINAHAAVFGFSPSTSSVRTLEELN